ncbi:hypothetical protein B0A55_07322 [Friedmanniomyces simplex]|uniref:Uncharacterized protein n=1 Tax=Friedmanniomyces simplex TaxID=329884 RepID=A0A4U0XDZ9_9PEZI|nr:hypothetical protein B0A55_07322 [Friedmanniomyces simplex]
MAEPQTCTGCRKQKAQEEFWRRNRTNLTCNQCSERLRTRKQQMAAQKAAQGGQQQQPQPQQQL